MKITNDWIIINYWNIYVCIYVHICQSFINNIFHYGLIKWWIDEGGLNLLWAEGPEGQNVRTSEGSNISSLIVSLLGGSRPISCLLSQRRCRLPLVFAIPHHIRPDRRRGEPSRRRCSLTLVRETTRRRRNPSTDEAVCSRPVSLAPPPPPPSLRHWTTTVTTNSDRGRARLLWGEHRVLVKILFQFLQWSEEIFSCLSVFY